MRRLNQWGALLLATAVVLGTPGAVSASARADKTVRLRQRTPVNAAGMAGGACPVPADKDGWHFSLADAPRSVTFESVTVTFDVGGTQTVAAGGRDAYVASERGANLTRATAVVDGPLLSLPLVRYFDLVGTCPGQAPPPPPAEPAPAPAPVDQPAQPAQPEQPGQPAQPERPDRDGGDGPQRPGNAGTDDEGPAAPTPTPPTALPTDGVTELPKVPGGPDQPELRVATEDGAAPVPAAAEEPSGGLGIQGFALIAAGVFLLFFGGAVAYLNVRRRNA